MYPGRVTVKDMAALLGLQPGYVRKVIAAHDIQPVGHWWKAKVYNPDDLLAVLGGKHRPHGAAREREKIRVRCTHSPTGDPENGETPARRQPPGARSD
jgi:hypothetical protein